MLPTLIPHDAPARNSGQARPRAVGSVRVFSMAAAAAAPASKPAVQVVDAAHGFKLQRQQFVKEYDSTVLLYKHEKTGERVRMRQSAALHDLVPALAGL